MNFWLVKSEPDTYSYERLEREGRTMWEGVRNYAARNNLRAMREGDLVLFYHSVTGTEVVGICKIAKEAYPDPTAEKGDWSVVDVVPVKKLNKPVSLQTIKATPELQNTALIRIGRLSVMPLEKEALELTVEIGETSV